jgi:hypothetical protein
MKPNEIKRLGRAHDLGEVAMSRFIMRYVGWEALQFRTLVVACWAKGWSVEDAELVLDASGVSSIRRFKEVLEKILDRPPRFNSNVIELLEIAETTRNKLVHGVIRPSKGVLDELSEVLADVVAGRLVWLETTKIRKVDVAEPLQALRKHKRPEALNLLAEKLGVHSKRLERVEDAHQRIPKRRVEVEKMRKDLHS